MTASPRRGPHRNEKVSLLSPEISKLRLSFPLDCNEQNVLSRLYLVPIRLPAPESADLPIIEEDLVATEPVTPPGGNATDDDESHMRIIGLRPVELDK